MYVTGRTIFLQERPEFETTHLMVSRLSDLHLFELVQKGPRRRFLLALRHRFEFLMIDL